MMVAGLRQLLFKHRVYRARRGLRTAFEVFGVFLAWCDVEEYGDAEFCLGDICIA